MKVNLRKQCLEKRNALNEEEIINKSHLICHKLIKLLDKNLQIMSYIPIKNEVDTSLLEDYFKDIAYPVILDNYEMEARISNEMIKNKYGILEPKNGKLLNIEDLDVIIIPIVGFDLNMHRIGYGKGYYDRFLKNINAKKIGLAYECQKVDHIDIDENDIKLDLIITENNIYQ